MNGHPLDEQLRELVRHLQRRYLVPMEAEVLAQAADGSLELRLLADPKRLEELELIRGMQGVPLALQGCWAVKLAPQARVVVEWLDGDPQKPVVRSILSGTFLEVSVDATTQIKIGATAATVALGKALKPVASAGDTTEPVVNGNPAKITVVANTVVKV